ncbi:MAG: GNAT family N-acetyltransferase [Oscillospiraceae bacterium]|nr:GNAT family N-acetyltransferase [Oscillospiraceae bacterium]
MTDTRTFETERLICRPFEADDLHDMFTNWASDPDIQPEYGEPVYDTIDAAKGLLEKYLRDREDPDNYRWAIIEKASGQNIGQIAFCKVYNDVKTAEIEYCIGKEFWGKGYAGEALSGLIGYSFTHTDFEKLEAYHRAENPKSGRVLQKSSMTVTDTVERFIREGISPEGEVCYHITREQFGQ